MYFKFAILVLAVAVCPGTEKAVGTYAMKGGNFLEVSEAQNGEFDVSLFGSSGGNSCEVETGPRKLENCAITYTQADEDDNCTIRVVIESKSAKVEQTGVCGCGLNVNLSGVYHRQKTAIRKPRDKSS